MVTSRWGRRLRRPGQDSSSCRSSPTSRPRWAGSRPSASEARPGASLSRRRAVRSPWRPCATRTGFSSCSPPARLPGAREELTARLQARHPSPPAYIVRRSVRIQISWSARQVVIRNQRSEIVRANYNMSLVTLRGRGGGLSFVNEESSSSRRPHSRVRLLPRVTGGVNGQDKPSGPAWPEPALTVPGRAGDVPGAQRPAGAAGRTRPEARGARAAPGASCR